MYGYQTVPASVQLHIESAVWSMGTSSPAEIHYYILEILEKGHWFAVIISPSQGAFFKSFVLVLCYNLL